MISPARKRLRRSPTVGWHGNVMKNGKALRITSLLLVGTGVAGLCLLLFDLSPMAGLFESHPIGMIALFIFLTTAGFSLELTPHCFHWKDWAVRWFLLAAVLSPLAAVAVFSLQQTEKGLTEIAFSQRSSLARLAAMTLKERFDRVMDLSVSLSTRVQFGKLVAGGRWEEAGKILERIPRDFPFVDRILLTDTLGVLMADIPEVPDVKKKSFAFRDWYRGVMEERDTYISEIYQRTAPPRVHVVAVATPIRNERQNLCGIMVLQIGAETFFQWGQNVEVGPEGYAYFVDARGHAIGLPGVNPTGAVTDYRRVPSVQKLLEGESGIDVQFNPVAGEERLSAYEPVPGYGWGVVVQQPTRTAFAERNESLRRLSVIYGFILLFGSLCAYTVFRAFIMRKRAEKALRKSEEKYRTLFNSIDIGVCTIEVLFDGNDKPVDYRFLEVNSSFERQTGIQDAPGKRMREIAPLHEEHWFEIYGKIALSGEPRRFENQAAQLHRWYEVYAFRVGEPRQRQVAIYFNDITERKQVEREIEKLNETLRQHAQQLEAANKELEAFSYSVSHDLRAPLRSIDGFSQALLEDYNEKLDSHGKSYLERVRAATQRMGQLIDDMLDLSRVTRTEMRQEKVDISALAEAIALELKSSAPERKAEFVIRRGLCATGDARLLRVVLQNLLGNAWKFTSKRHAAQIEFGATARPDGKTAFFVRDNGAGFDMAYAHKLFGVFQRLHGMAEFEGTGVGLATVQRIIRRHGGEAWAEGKVEEGAAFYFTL
jgi:PAS domain S-box-containing protein